MSAQPPRDPATADTAGSRDDALLREAALDRALRRVLAPPSLPDGFAARLAAAVQRAGEPDSLRTQRTLAAEYARQAEALRNGYVRLQWRTLGTLIGAAFVAGITLTLALPYVRATWGGYGVLATAVIGALVGIGLGARSWLGRSSLWRGA